ncbi:hypothetical protein [Flavobacterium sp.]|uniref:hypothetical protein n=1 Tax=Flavobacterium sp. TaxID=239 RepID=UPI0026175B75|nr:hypothetical protein [Flavobacterium sp.]
MSSYSQQDYHFDYCVTYKIDRRSYEPFVYLKSIYTSSKDSLILANVITTKKGKISATIIDYRSRIIHYYTNRPRRDKPTEHNFVYDFSYRMKGTQINAPDLKIYTERENVYQDSIVTKSNIKMFLVKRKKKHIFDIYLEAETTEKDFFPTFQRMAFRHFEEVQHRFMDRNVLVKTAIVRNLSETNLSDYFQLIFNGPTDFSLSIDKLVVVKKPKSFEVTKS